MIILKKEFSGFTKDIKINVLDHDWEAESEYNLNNLLYLYNIEVIKDINKEYNKLISLVNTNNINYKYLLGERKYIDKINKVKISLNKIMHKDNLEYINILGSRINFTSNFTNFSYKGNEYTPGIYDHLTSSTGRVKIKNADINLLTLKKEERKNIDSAYVGGRIYAIDIISLEPRVMMHMQGVKGITDIYTHIQSKLSKNYERSKIKIGVISTIYGGANKTVKSVSGISYSDIKIIKDYFGIQKFIDRYKDNKIIRNYYGRPIKVTNAIVNHYIQSSSADCAILAFNKLMNEWKNLRVNFIGFIHDAIIIDVHPDHFDNIENLEGVYESKMNIILPVKVEKIS